MEAKYQKLAPYLYLYQGASTQANNFEISKQEVEIRIIADELSKGSTHSILSLCNLKPLINHHNKSTKPNNTLSYDYPVCVLAKAKGDITKYENLGLSRVLIKGKLVPISEANEFWHNKIPENPFILLGLANSKEEEEIILKSSLSDEHNYGVIKKTSNYLSFSSLGIGRAHSTKIDINMTIKESYEMIPNSISSVNANTLKSRLEILSRLVKGDIPLNKPLEHISYSNIAVLKLISYIFSPKINSNLFIEGILEFIQNQQVEEIIINKLKKSHSKLYITKDPSAPSTSVLPKPIKLSSSSPSKIIDCREIDLYTPRVAMLSEINSIYTEFSNLLLNKSDFKIRGITKNELKLKNIQCSNCQGAQCENCFGYRIKYQYNQIAFKGINISSFLKLRIKESLTLFSSIPKLSKKLSQLALLLDNELTLDTKINELSFKDKNKIKLLNKITSSSYKEGVYNFEAYRILGDISSNRALVIDSLEGLIGEESLDAISKVASKHNTMIIDQTDTLIRAS